MLIKCLSKINKKFFENLKKDAKQALFSVHSCILSQVKFKYFLTESSLILFHTSRFWNQLFLPIFSKLLFAVVQILLLTKGGEKGGQPTLYTFLIRSEALGDRLLSGIKLLFSASFLEIYKRKLAIYLDISSFLL